VGRARFSGDDSGRGPKKITRTCREVKTITVGRVFEVMRWTGRTSEKTTRYHYHTCTLCTVRVVVCTGNSTGSHTVVDRRSRKGHNAPKSSSSTRAFLWSRRHVDSHNVPRRWRRPCALRPTYERRKIKTIPKKISSPRLERTSLQTRVSRVATYVPSASQSV